MESRVGPDMTEVRVLIQFGTLRVQKSYFDEIYERFCIIFAGEAEKSRYFNKSRHTGAAFGGRPSGSVCLMDILMDIYGYIINISGYISYTFLI